jgi:XTP/dITP diphosphohydrolase
MGALARAQKMVSRVKRDERIVNALASVSENVDNSNDAVKIGNELLDLVRRAARQGVDAEGALRQALTEFERDVRSAESSLLDHP